MANKVRGIGPDARDHVPSGIRAVSSRGPAVQYGLLRTDHPRCDRLEPRIRSRHKPAEEEKMKKFTRGAVAGAAGTTALNAVGYADMALRGRPASSTPARVAEQLARRVGGTIPGSGAARQNRAEGLGALAGIATGAGVGALAGQLRGALRRPGALSGPAGIAGAGTLGTALRSTGLGVSAPGAWDGAPWRSVSGPHPAS